MKNDYEVRGDVTAIFMKYKGNVYETIIDTDDLPKAQKYENTWFIKKEERSHTAYVVSSITENGKREYIRLHRYLMNPPSGMEIDHINGNGLDNRRSVNLRNATIGENRQNKRGAQTNNRTSGIRGVYFNKQSKKWRARIMLNKKEIWIGAYNTSEEAEVAVKEARRKYMPYSQEASA